MCSNQINSLAAKVQYFLFAIFEERQCYGRIFDRFEVVLGQFCHQLNAAGCQMERKDEVNQNFKSRLHFEDRSLFTESLQLLKNNFREVSVQSQTKEWNSIDDLEPFKQNQFPLAGFFKLTFKLDDYSLSLWLSRLVSAFVAETTCRNWALWIA